VTLLYKEGQHHSPNKETPELGTESAFLGPTLVFYPIGFSSNSAAMFILVVGHFEFD